MKEFSCLFLSLASLIGFAFFADTWAEKLTTWIPGLQPNRTFAGEVSALIRVPRFPRSIPYRETHTLYLQSVRNGQVSAQIAVMSATKDIKGLNANVSDLVNPKTGSRINSDNISVRLVGYLPIVESWAEKNWRDPGPSVVAREGAISKSLVADPLLPKSKVDVNKGEAQPIWFTFRIPKTTTPGTYDGIITINSSNLGSKQYKLQLEVVPITLPDPKNYKHSLDHWEHPMAIAVLASLEPWSEEHWKLIRIYLNKDTEFSNIVLATLIS